MYNLNIFLKVLSAGITYLVQDMVDQGWLSVSPASAYSGARMSPAALSSFS